jgi:hypothetical protein
VIFAASSVGKDKDETPFTQQSMLEKPLRLACLDVVTFVMRNGQTTAVLEEMLEPVTRAFSRDVAQALVNIRASDTAQARITELAEKCNEGLLTPDERAQYETYVNAVDLISLLQAKARVWLARHAS